MWDLIVSVPDHCLSFYFIQVKIKYEFSQPFHCDCWYVQQNMIIHDILIKPFSEKYKILRKVNEKDFFLLKTMHF